MSAKKTGLERSQEKEWDSVWKKRNIASDIVDFGRKIYAYFFQRVLKRYLPKDAEMLELGCGTSVLSISLANLTKKITALDISQTSLDISSKNAKEKGAANMDFVIGDCKNVQYANKFDFVWSNGLLEHFEDPESVAREHFKAAKKGGSVLIAVPYYYSYHKIWYVISRPKLLRKLWLWLDVEQIFFTKKMLRDIGKKITPNHRVFFLQPLPLGMVFLELRK